jgi:hypothetical protein
MLRRFRLPFLVLALSTSLALTLPGAASQEAAQETPQETAALDKAAADLAKDHERVLTLRSGQRLRMRAKLEDGQWLVRMNGGWSGLPAGLVTDSSTVKALMKEAKKRERLLKLSEPDQRAELAFWLAEHGLYNEALEHLDINLRKSPDHESTLAILDRGMVPVRLDAYVPETGPAADASPEVWLTATRDLFDRLARLSPATREVAWRAIRPLFTTEDRMPAFLAATTELLADRSSARRKLAAAALQRLAIDQLKDESPTAQATVKELIHRAVLDGNEPVREAAARALRDLDEPSVTAPFVKALSSSSSAVRANAAEALGVIGVPAIAPALVSALAATSAAGSVTRAPASSIFFGRQIAYIQDFDVEAFSGAVAADPQINVLTEGAVLDVRVLSISQRQALSHERSSLRGALRQLCGQDFHYDTKKWSQWLEEHPANQ